MSKNSKASTVDTQPSNLSSPSFLNSIKSPVANPRSNTGSRSPSKTGSRSPSKTGSNSGTTSSTGTTGTTSSSSFNLGEEMEHINELKEKVNNSTHVYFDGKCVRKKANLSKLSRMYKFDKPDFKPDKLLEDLPIISPKLKKLLGVIDDLDKSDLRNHGKLFKHFIFSDIKNMQGTKAITSALIAKGMTLGYTSKFTPIGVEGGVNGRYRAITLTSKETLVKNKSNNFYLLSSVGVFDQTLTTPMKKEILTTFNSRPDNVHGDIARIIVMDSGFKEGIDLFDIKYIHIFEPQTTMADQKQVIGRGTRTCGQKGLVFHPTMGWPLFVFNYDIEINEKYRKTFNNSTSTFDLYLKSMKIDLRLFHFLKELEETYTYGSVDYKLNENIHNFAIAAVGSANMGSSTKYSSARAISSLKTGDFDIGNSSKYSSARAISSLKTDDFDIGDLSPSKETTISSLSKGGLNTLSKSDSSKSRNKDPDDVADGSPSQYTEVSLDETGEIKFPDFPLDFKGTRKFIDKYFSQYKWTNVVMENLCGYAGPSLEKENKKLPPRPLSLGNTTSSSGVEEDEFIPLPDESPFTTINTSSSKSSRTPPPGPNPSPASSFKEMSSLTYSKSFPSSKSKTQNKSNRSLSLKNSLVNSKTTSLKESSTKSTSSKSPVLNISKSSSSSSSSNTPEVDVPVPSAPVPVPTNSPKSTERLPFPKTNAYGLEELKVYSKSDSPKPLSNGGMYGGADPTLVNLSPSQAFIQHYFTPNTPQKGVLLNWSVGTGKTCAAIATATSSFESAGYTILWVTRTTLKSDIWKNMFEQVCSDKIRKLIEDNVANGTPIPKEPDARMRLLSESWSIRPMSYKQFSNLVSQKNSFYTSLVNKNGKKDPLRKTLLIIDEAHKLYGGNDLSSIERPDMNALHNALMNSYIVSGKDSVRIMLMTATPITVDPMELIKLVNLCKPPEKQMPETFNDFDREYKLNEEGGFTKEGKKLFLDEIAGYISYLNREKDARQFSQPIIKQVAVPLVGSSEVEALIEKYDIPFEEDVDTEQYKTAQQLEEELKKQTDKLEDWEAFTTKAKFKDMVDKCDGLEKELKKKCVKTVNQHISEIITKSKTETNIIKERIKEIKGELKNLNMFKKLKLRETRENIKLAGKDYERFKDTLYNNLKRVCGKKIKDFSNLKKTTDELPEIAEINRMIEETDESLKQLEDEFQSKIKMFQNEIELLKTKFMKQKGLTPDQKLRAIEEFNEEKERKTRKFQEEKFKVGKMKIQLNKTKKMYGKQKTKFIVKIKKKIEKEVKTKTTELKKTKKLKKKVEDLNVANGAEELKNLVMEKQAIIEEEIKKFYIENKDVEIANREKEAKKKEEKEMKEQEAKRKKEEKEIKEQETKRKKEEEQRKKEEEKRKKDEENKGKNEEGQRKKEEEQRRKEEEQRKKNEEKEEAKRKKEEEKRKKDEEKEEAKRKKEEEKQTRKLEKKSKNNKTKKNGST